MKAQEKNESKKRIIIIVILAFAGVLGAIYVGVSIYFIGRFLFNTAVNGEGVSGLSANAGRQYIEGRAEDFYITIVGVGDLEEIIYGPDFDLSFEVTQPMEEVVDVQNPFAWPVSLVSSQELEVEISVAFDEQALKERIAELQIVTDGETPPVSARVILENGEAVVVPEEHGDTIDVEKMSAVIYQAVNSFEREVCVMESALLMQPEFTSESPEIVSTVEVVNRYLDAQVTYEVGREVTVDRELIADWLRIDEELNVTLEEGLVNEWLAEFIATVNTHGTTRQITTPRGRTVDVTGGYYGWIVDAEPELEELLKNIRAGEVISREPIYSQTAASHGPQDWGNTFLQVDMAEQHMWAFIDGEIVFESPVVTGLPRYGRNTPQGVYFILEMQRGRTLRGAPDPETGEPIYETPVAYWMRTTWSGHGFHDAVWQPTFGGTRYRTNGSHGCTNLPLAAASELFNMIHLMMPVVVHY